jgi:hypothetical protein
MLLFTNYLATLKNIEKSKQRRVNDPNFMVRYKNKYLFLNKVFLIFLKQNLIKNNNMI